MAPMARYKATFITTLSVTVEVEADDEDHAADAAWEYAEAYVNTLHGDGLHVTGASASFDGVGADTVEEVADRG